MTREIVININLEDFTAIQPKKLPEDGRPLYFGERGQMEAVPVFTDPDERIELLCYECSIHLGDGRAVGFLLYPDEDTGLDVTVDMLESYEASVDWVYE